MNRRDILKASPLLAALPFVARAKDSDQPRLENENRDHYPQCGRPCAMTVALAHEVMAETGDWKEHILKSRNQTLPMLVTRYGCCGCEISLREGAHHPDWTYTPRPLTSSERDSFHREYGNAATLLTALTFSPTLEIRGFILNGRKEGWNLSVRTIKQ